MEKLQNKIPFRLSLKAARINAKLNQEQVAEKMGVTRHTVINWEKGKTVPGIPEKEMLSSMYGIPIDYIF